MLEALLKKKNQDGRFRYLYWVVIAIFVILVSRLIYLQLFAGEYYHSLAEGNRLRAIPIAAMRGIMYDRNGQILVGSRPSFMATYVPPKGGMSDEELAKLAGILNVPEDKLRDKIQKVKSSYVPTVLANDLTQDIVTKIEEQRNDLPGVSVEVQPIRYYPYKTMAAQVSATSVKSTKKMPNGSKGWKASPILPKSGGPALKPITTISCEVRTAAVRSKSMRPAVRSRKWNEKNRWPVTICT